MNPVVKYRPTDWIDNILELLISFISNIAEPKTRMFEKLRTYAVLHFLLCCLDKGKSKNGPLNIACFMKFVKMLMAINNSIICQKKTYGLILID